MEPHPRVTSVEMQTSLPQSLLLQSLQDEDLARLMGPYSTLLANRKKVFLPFYIFPHYVNYSFRLSRKNPYHLWKACWGGFGKRPPPILATQTLSSDPTSSSPHSRPWDRVSQPPPLPAKPALPPTAGGPGFPKQNTEPDFPAREGPLDGAHRTVGGQEGLANGQLLKPGAKPWSALSTPAGPPLVGPPYPFGDKPPSCRSQASPDPYLPGPPNFPALNLARLGVREVSLVPGCVPGARSCRAFRLAGPPCGAWGQPLGGQRGPSPGRPGGGAGQGAGRTALLAPAAPLPAYLLTPTV